MAENIHETKIVINGDDSGAIGALSRVKSAINGGFIGALNGVRSAISKVIRSIGTIGLVLHGIQYAVDGFKKFWGQDPKKCKLYGTFKGPHKIYIVKGRRMVVLRKREKLNSYVVTGFKADDPNKVRNIRKEGKLLEKGEYGLSKGGGPLFCPGRTIPLRGRLPPTSKCLS